MSRLGCCHETRVSAPWTALLESLDTTNLTLSLSSGLGSAKCIQYSLYCKIDLSSGNLMPSYSLGATQRTESRKCTKSYAGVKRERRRGLSDLRELFFATQNPNHNSLCSFWAKSAVICGFGAVITGHKHVRSMSTLFGKIQQSSLKSPA